MVKPSGISNLMANHVTYTKKILHLINVKIIQVLVNLLEGFLQVLFYIFYNQFYKRLILGFLIRFKG